MQFDLNPVPGVARALYSYQAQSAEELSFQEGALIHLIRCRHGEVCVCVQFRGWSLRDSAFCRLNLEDTSNEDFADFEIPQSIVLL